jgi:hypothetical protein
MVYTMHLDSWHSAGVGNRLAALLHSIIGWPYVQLIISEVTLRFLTKLPSLRRTEFRPKEHPQQILVLCMYKSPPGPWVSPRRGVCKCTILLLCGTRKIFSFRTASN